MSEETSGDEISDGICGCMFAILILVGFVFFVKAWLFGGLPIVDKTWGVEIIPPRIYEVEK